MRVLNWLPAFTFAGLIFLVSHQQEPPGAVVIDLVSDYILHFAAYGVLGLCLAWGATQGLRQRLSGRMALLMILIGMLYGASDEWHQSFVPGRTTSFSDWAADSLGAAASILGWLFYQVRSLRRSQRMKSTQ